MKNVLYLALLLFSAGCGGSKTLISRTDTKSIRIDGHIQQDWENALSFHTNPKLQYGVRNDGTYLYIAMATADESLQRQIVMGGLEVSFQTKAAPDWGIRFPLGMRGQNRRPDIGTRPDNGERPDMHALVRNSLQAADAMAIFDRNDVEGKRVPLNGLNGILIQAKMEDDVLSYELRVPLKAAGDFDYGIGAGAGETLELRLATANGMPIGRRGMHDGQRGGMGGGMNDGQRGGMGGRPGGMEGGRPMGGPPSGGAMLQPLSLKLKVKVS